MSKRTVVYCISLVHPLHHRSVDIYILDSFVHHFQVSLQGNVSIVVTSKPFLSWRMLLAFTQDPSFVTSITYPEELIGIPSLACLGMLTVCSVLGVAAQTDWTYLFWELFHSFFGVNIVWKTSAIPQCTMVSFADTAQLSCSFSTWPWL